uniref:Uncharacterized protein n=1 Tax=Carcinus maenas virus 1 TaxID=2704945 RepID=A0A6G9HDA7_9VIRU|nr:hypothetical protein [Carcinus maenas virus 1]
MVDSDTATHLKLIIQGLASRLTHLALVMETSSPQQETLKFPAATTLELQIKHFFIGFVTDVYACLEMSNDDLVRLINDNIQNYPQQQQHLHLLSRRQRHRSSRYYNNRRRSNNRYSELFDMDADVDDATAAAEEKYYIEYMDLTAKRSLYKESLKDVFSPDNDVWKLRFKHSDKATGPITLTVPRLTLILLIICQNTMVLLKSMGLVGLKEINVLNAITLNLYHTFRRFEFGNKNQRLFSDHIQPDIMSMLSK